MQIQIPPDKEPFVKSQALAAGFASVDQYILSLIVRDDERTAVKAAIEDMKHGRIRPFDDFDHEFREEQGIKLQT